MTKNYLRAVTFILAAAALYLYIGHGQYGLASLIQRGMSPWVEVSGTDARLSDGVRAALQETVPPVSGGPYQWKSVGPGLDVAELPVLASGKEVDRILLSRVDPAQYRIVVRNHPAASRTSEDWVKLLGAAVVINGSYYDRGGFPDTPFVEDGKALGPSDYQAREGAFIAGPGAPEIVDLASRRWQDVFAGAKDALVSYPLLVTPNGPQHAIKPSRWLASRSFIAQDAAGKIIFGTTTDGFFSLDRLAAFLRASDLGLTGALNLDGGPVASQSVRSGDFTRNFHGKWELQITPDGQAHLLTWQRGVWGLPVVIAAIRNETP